MNQATFGDTRTAHKVGSVPEFQIAATYPKIRNCPWFPSNLNTSAFHTNRVNPKVALAYAKELGRSNYEISPRDLN